MTYIFSLGDFIYKLIISLISRFIFKKLEPHLNPNGDFERYAASFGAAFLFFVSTGMFIIAVMSSYLAFYFGFTFIKFVIISMFIALAIAAFREHRAIINTYNKKRQSKGN